MVFYDRINKGTGNYINVTSMFVVEKGQVSGTINKQCLKLQKHLGIIVLAFLESTIRISNNVIDNIKQLINKIYYNKVRS